MQVLIRTSEVTPTSTAMKGPTGKVMTDTSEILESWRVYCDNLYFEENILPTNVPLESVEMEPVPLRSEVASALSSMSARKALGSDEIPIELLQQGGEKMIDLLYKLVVTVWNTGVWPADWCKSVCVPILKKGDSREHENCRTLPFISHASKILLCIFKERIHAKGEFESSSEQAGFRQGRGSHNHVTSFRILTEKDRARKQPLFFCFVDFQQAFDSVCHAKLWKRM